MKVQTFQKMCETIRTLRQDAQLKFYKVMAVSLITYVRENSTLNRIDRRRNETAKMKYQGLQRVFYFRQKKEYRNKKGITNIELNTKDGRNEKKLARTFNENVKRRDAKNNTFIHPS